MNITCPFCHDSDFDLIGLKLHLANGWCDPFNELRREEYHQSQPRTLADIVNDDEAGMCFVEGMEMP